MAREAVLRGVPAAGVRRLGVGWEAPALLAIAATLVCFGVVSVYSASAVLAQTLGLPHYHFVVRQAAGGAAGMLALAVFAHLDPRVWRRAAWPLLAVVVALLTLLVLPGTERIAPEVNGARRWLVLGPVALQPSELAKLALVVWTAALAVKKQDRLRSLSRGLLPFLLVWGLVAGLILLEPNLSTALLVVLLAALVVFAAGGRIGHFLVLALLSAPLLWSQVESAPYRLRRVLAFLDPSRDLAGIGYQIHQSLIALGSGGPLGRGFGRGQQKFGFLPEPHNDFIFAMIGEEWGLVGVAALVALYLAFALVGYRVARQAPDLFGSLLAIGVTNLVVVQALLHMAVATALAPATGVPLPLVSYGRSSLLVTLAAVGILLSIARAAGRRGV